MAGVQDTSSFKIEKLTSDNYHSWKFSMKMFLIGKDLFEIVAGNEVLAEEANADEKTKFKKKANLALATICLSVSNNLHIYVRSCQTGKEAWDCLANHFEEKTLSKKIFYRRKLYSARMSKGTDMVTHINYVKTLSEHLQAVDDPVSDKDLVMILISSFPEEYNTLITALETLAEDKLKWEYVRDRMMTEYERRKGHQKNPDALFMQREAGNGDKQSRKPFGTYNKYKKTFKCHNCHQKGHFAKNCPKRKPDDGQSNDGNTRGKADHGLVATEFDYTPEFALEVGADSEGVHWWIDSGASQHMTSNKDELVDYKEFNSPSQINLADNSALYAYGKGNVHLSIYCDTIKYDIELRNVLFVPKIQNKLLSLSAMMDQGIAVQFKGNTCNFSVNNKQYTVGHRHGKLFKLNCTPVGACCFGSSASVSFSTWHQRYGHLGYDNLKLLNNRSMVDGMKLNSEVNVEDCCESCIMGKHNRQPFPKKSLHNSTKPLELIHSDLCGPMSVNSVGGSRYFATFIDDFSRYIVVYPMKRKSELPEKFSEYRQMAENMFGYKVKKIRSDNGGEYTSDEFVSYLKNNGILKEETIPYSPQQNGVAERCNRTLMESVRCMLYHASLPLKFWAEALATAVHVRNRSPTSCIQGETPYERWYNEKPDVGHLRVFGCNAYMHIPDEKRKKLDQKSLKCIFIGYPYQSKGYKLYDPVTGKMSRSRDVVFVENKFSNLCDKDEPDELLPDKWFYNDIINLHDNAETIAETDEVDNLLNFEIAIGDNNHDDAHNDVPGDNFLHPENVENIQGRPQRTRRGPDRLGEWEYANMAIAEEPRNIHEALKGEYANQWKEAAQNEYNSLIDNKTWKLVDLPQGKNVVGSKWIFKIKHDANGEVDRFKARLVAQGYSQEYGVDYNEVFAPVAKYTSIRSILAIANQLDLEVHQMDVKSAFLNGTLDEEIYMRQPECFVDSSNPEKVCHLNKSLYGLKQSARCWNDVIDKYLKSDGFIQSSADPCIYTKRTTTNGNNVLMVIGVYVDDTILASNDINTLNAEKVKLSKRFEMDDRGEIHHLLGMRINRDRKSKILMIDQSIYLQNVLKRFGFEDCKPVSTPMEPGLKLQKLTDDDNDVDTVNYQAVIGSLIYASICTRPDISAAVSYLSQFMTKPGAEHWVAIKRILRYIKGTLDQGLKFVATEDFRLHGYTDADWAGDTETRKSRSGYVFMLGGATVSWTSKKQSVVALSSTEAEYIALSLAAQEIIWLRRLLESLTITQNTATVLFEDNQGAIALGKNPKDHARTKHIEIKYHFVRHTIQNKSVELQYCPTNEMAADIFTKPLQKLKFAYFRCLIGVNKW